MSNNLAFLLIGGLVISIAFAIFLDQLHRFKLSIVEQLNHKHNLLHGTLHDALGQHSQVLSTNMQQINALVEQRLNDGFTKTTATFSDIAKRLILIDDAQKKLTDLSNNVLSLQAILSDKKSRGAFGEVQLNNLISNLLPAKSYALQHQLSNGLRCDCMLFLPAPTGNLAIDAKFPLENYQRYHDLEEASIERKRYMQSFSQDIKRHINDIAIKYIVAGETTDGAIMFIPAEAIFAEIHSKYPDVVNLAQNKRVWLTSPTTMMAILTTACAVLKDSATREHVHYIQEHLRVLAKDFERFNERMEKLTKHIELANNDAKEINTSAGKITRRFEAIEKVEIANENVDLEM